jgi:hypothetical protein
MGAVAIVLLAGGAGLLVAGSRRRDDSPMPVRPRPIPAPVS